MLKSIIVAIVALSALTGCQQDKPQVDAECYFSSTGTTAQHFTNQHATQMEYSHSMELMSGWAWTVRVTDALSDATCHTVDVH